MESLPDDVWHQILQKGIQAGQLDHVDLCSLAIVNSHYDQLTQDPALWATLLSRDFPLSIFSFEAPSKSLYRVKRESKRWRFIPFRRLGRLSIFEDFKAIDISLARPVNSRRQLNRSGALPLYAERDPVLPNASQPSLKQERNRYYENKPSKCFDKSSRPKVIPNSKSYIPMNRPPRRSMPRKN